MLPSGQHWGHLCATQVLRVSAGMPSWDKTSNLQEAVPCLTGESVGNQSPTWTLNCYMRHEQLSICFSSLLQVPIDVTAGWAASPVGTRPPGPHYNSWVDWSNENNFLSQENDNNTKVASAGNRTWNLLITRLMPLPLGYAALHKHTHTHNQSGNNLLESQVLIISVLLVASCYIYLNCNSVDLLFSLIF